MFPFTLRRRNLKTHEVITGSFRFVAEVNSDRGIVGLSCCHRKAGVFKFLRFEECFQEAPVSKQTTVQPRSQGLSSSRSRGWDDERPWERGWLLWTVKSWTVDPTVRTAQSQHHNVYKHNKSHSMECESMLFVKNHKLCIYFWPIRSLTDPT